KVPFVRYWLHNGFVLFNETKMSKSLGNVISLTEAIERHDPVAVRLFILQSHYRSPLNLSDEGFEAAERGVDRLRGALEGDDVPASSEGGAPGPASSEARAPGRASSEGRTPTEIVGRARAA